GDTACWGWNFHGEVGNGEFDGYVTKPSGLAFAADVQAAPSDSASASETPSESPTATPSGSASATPSASTSGTTSASPSSTTSTSPSTSSSAGTGSGEAGEETEPPSTAKLATTGAPIARIFLGG